MYDGISTKFIGDGGAPTGPSISGSNIVWYNDGESEKVYYYNGSSVVALGTYCGDSPRVSGSNVVWSQWDGNDYEIHFFDGNIATQLTDNDTDDLSPEVSGRNVAWRSWDGHDWEIYTAAYIPEPATLSLLALGGLVIIQKRRKSR